MAQGKKTDPKVVAAIEGYLDQYPKATAVAICKVLKRKAGGVEWVGLRKVQQIKKDWRPPAKRRSQWRPWDKKYGIDDLLNALKSRTTEDIDFLIDVLNPGNSEGVDYLLELDALNIRDTGQHLYQDQVPWAKRLRVALQGLPMYDQLWIIREYAGRARSADRHDSKPEFDDLDGILAYKPWRNAFAYECALIAGLVLHPPVFDTPEMDERLEALGHLLLAPDDEGLRARYRTLPSYWECVRYQMKPPNFREGYPLTLARSWPEAEWTVKARAADEIAGYWDTDYGPSGQSPRATQRMVIESLRPASDWAQIDERKKGEGDERLDQETREE